MTFKLHGFEESRPVSRIWIALRGFGFAVLFITLWGIAAWLCRPVDQYIPIHFPSGTRILGDVLMSIGVALTLITAGYFVINGRGTPAIFDPPKEFVFEGLNRFVRNPIYIGYVAWILGLGLYYRSISIILFAVAAFLLIHTFVVFAEEPGLRRRFGVQYENYCRAVPRWLPRFTPPRLPT
jgi:protein-S-isoprenylcysteine O-methyltransferase Ste14